MSTPSFTVTCPCCEARLTIDPDLAAVVAHEEPPRKRSVSDIDAAFDVLKSKSAEREERFRREMEARASRYARPTGSRRSRGRMRRER